MHTNGHRKNNKSQETDKKLREGKTHHLYINSGNVDFDSHIGANIIFAVHHGNSQVTREASDLLHFEEEFGPRAQVQVIDVLLPGIHLHLSIHRQFAGFHNCGGNLGMEICQRKRARVYPSNTATKLSPEPIPRVFPLSLKLPQRRQSPKTIRL